MLLTSATSTSQSKPRFMFFGFPFRPICKHRSSYTTIFSSIFAGAPGEVCQTGALNKRRGRVAIHAELNFGLGLGEGSGAVHHGDNVENAFCPKLKTPSELMSENNRANARYFLWLGGSDQTALLISCTSQRNCTK